ncbi:MAG: PAS domain S-box protein [Candidatus Magnetominusculus sp. LBB02]|nr:PAS domain S-box protein [Candidatus Magnetominusculus sp. LBB02]
MINKLKSAATSGRYSYILSLRFIIQLIFALTTILCFLLVNYFERQRSLKQIVQEGEREVMHLTADFQDLLEHLLSDNSMYLVQKQIELHGSNVNFRKLLLVDRNDNIIASSPPKWIEHKIGDVLEGNEKENFIRNIETTLSNRKASITISDNQTSIYALIPLYYGVSNDSQVSILVIDYDLSGQIARSNMAILFNSLKYSIFFIIANILMVASLRMLVMRRLVKLNAVVNRFASGDIASRADIGGTDEISNLAAGLNIMLDRIVETQSTLQSSKRELFDMLESISDGFFTLNREWRYTFLNTNAARMIKREVKDILGKIIWDEYPEAIDTRYYQLYSHVMETGEVTHFEEYYPALERWYEGTIYPYPDGISIYFQNVTERKIASEAIYKLQQKLSTHLEQTMFAVIEWDREFRVQYWNPAAEKIFGYTREQAKGRFASELIIPKSIHAEIASAWNILLKKSDSYCNTTENITKDGRTIICEWVNTPITDNEGNITGVISFANDITERRTVEEQFKIIIRTSLDFFLMLNKEAMILDANDSFCNAMGYSRDELLNMSVMNIEAAERPDEISQRIERIVSVGSDRFESKHKTRDGRIIDVEISINYMKASGIMFAFIRDITDKKKMAYELNEFNKTLQMRVNLEVEKNRAKDQLIYEQIRQISMSELLVNISHHWRQPLTSTSLLIQDIRDACRYNELDEAYLNKNIDVAMSELRSLSAMIDNFRNFYVQDSAPQQFNISAGINKTIALLSASFKERDIIVEKELDETLSVHGYHNDFAQVILNILNNAIDKFIKSNIRGGIIRIKLYRQDAGIIITIADNGGEIPYDIIGNVFDPYFTTKDKARGTGMGLYMAKVFIEKNMNGSITVRNTDGWCEFRIEI